MTDWITPLILACLCVVFVLAPQVKSIGAERSFVYAVSVGAAATLVWLLLSVSGCSRPVRAAEPTSTETPGHCFRLEGKYKGEQADGLICISIEEACLYAQAMAIRFGSMGNITVVGACHGAEEGL